MLPEIENVPTLREWISSELRQWRERRDLDAVAQLAVDAATDGSGGGVALAAVLAEIDDASVRREIARRALLRNTSPLDGDQLAAVGAALARQWQRGHRDAVAEEVAALADQRARDAVQRAACCRLADDADRETFERAVRAARPPRPTEDPREAGPCLAELLGSVR